MTRRSLAVWVVVSTAIAFCFTATNVVAQTTTDDFNREDGSPGANWTADSEYEIVSNELANTSTDYEWGHLAVFAAHPNANSAWFTWGVGADANGIKEGALAVMLDANSVNADGYIVWHSVDRVYLWTVENGAPGQSVTSVAANLPAPTAGQTMKAVMSSDDTGYHFDLYINDQFDGRVSDALKRAGDPAGYAGVMLRGNLNNNIDDFGARTIVQGTETLDDFDRADGPPGANWTADPEYEIVSNELANTTTSYNWGYLAIFNAHVAPNQVSFDWGVGADATGIKEGAFAVMMDENSVGANGYLVWHADSRIYLWTIVQGGPSEPVQNLTALQSAPVAGDNMKVVLSSDAQGYHFDLYINDLFDGRLTDANKRVGDPNGYAGVMLKGNLNNNIDNFACATVVDETAPSAVSDLSVDVVTHNSATLSWTAPGDDGSAGTAAAYDLRLSTSEITALNFDAATQVAGLPNPQVAGSAESATVSGLDPNTTYYFGIKARDDADNVSDISNVPFATTESAPQFASYWDEFERGELGADWVADPEYYIQDGELHNGAASTQWGFAAVFTKYPSPRSASIVWSENAVSGGIGQGAFCAYMDQADPNSNGYMAWQLGYKLYLYTIDAGNPGLEVDVIDTALPQATAEDTFKVIFNSDAAGHHFDAYVNSQFAGRLTDPSKFVNPDTWYAGVYLKAGLDNNVEAFGVELQSQEPAKVEYWSGTGQSEAVGKTLPMPMEVLVTDENDVPVPGIYVDFAVTSGSASLSTDIVGFDGNLWLEAESGAVESPMQTLGDADASGAQYVGVPTTGVWNDTGKVEIPVFVPQTGSYYLWARCKAPDNASNSLWVKKDRGGYTLWNLTVSTVWTWRKFSGALTFTKGGHMLTMRSGEDGTLLDKVLLTTSSTYTPTAYGESPTTYENKRTNGDGIASTICTLGLQVGSVTVEAIAYHRGATLPGSPVAFEATAVGGDPTQLIYESGDEQSGTAGQQLPNPFVVKVGDAFGYGVPGISVTFSILEGGGSLSNQQPVVTDNDGFASTYLTLGFGSYSQRVQASSPGLEGSPYVFTATVSIGLEMTISRVSENYQTGTVGTALPDPVVTKVTYSASGDPVEDFPVRYVITAGDDGSVDPVTGLLAGLKVMSRDGDALTLKKSKARLEPRTKVMALELVVNTNADGEAAVIWTLATEAGENTLEARATGVAGSPIVFNATGQPGAPTVLEEISGNDQNGPVGLPLLEPFRVRVTDQNGNGILGHNVHFAVTVGSGSLDGMTERNVPTDQDGYAEVTLTMGTVEGETNRVQATAEHDGTSLDNSPVTFTALSTEGVASELIEVSGNGQTAKVGTILPEPFVVLVTDVLGNVIENHPVHFAVINGGGKIGGQTEVDVLTNVDGEASVVLELGTVAGHEVHIVEVTSIGWNDAPLNGSPKYFRATATPGTPSRLIEVSGNHNSGAVGTTLNEPFKVKVADAFGNGINNHLVTFKVTEGGGSFPGVGTEQNVRTDSSGVAMAFLTLGTEPGEDNNVVEASARQAGTPLDGSPILFYATASSGIATSLVYVSGRNHSAEVGTIVPEPFVVRVEDSYHNPVEGFSVHFSVTQGGGHLAGATERDVLTLADGTAQVVLTLGTEAGTLNNCVRAAVTGLLGSPVDFCATALAGEASVLVEVSGNNQTGKVGKPLAEPFRTQVTDFHGNPIAGHKVTFEVIQGGGNLGGLDKLEVFTLASGHAEVILTLGPEPGPSNNVVEATSENAEGVQLGGSGMLFIASATVGDPHSIAIAEGNNQEGVVGNPLEQMLTVLVTDDQGNEIAGHSVTFRVLEGGGTLDGTVDTVLTKQTDIHGRAAVYLLLGPAAGQNNNRVQASAEHDGTPLDNSPVTFVASARPSNAAVLKMVSPNWQSGEVGKALLQALQVRTEDAGGNPVGGHPVTFEVLTGGGTLNGEGSLVVVNTGSDGIAEAPWTLGTEAGTNNNSVRASATDGVNPLVGSPQLFTATALPGPPDPEVSTVEAASPIPADGTSKSSITVSLRDEWDNPVSGASVTIAATGSNNFVTQPQNVTDENGETLAFLASTKAEVKTVSARVVNHQVDLISTAEVVFTPLAASTISVHAGNGQTGNIGTVLRQPVQALIADRYGNGILNHEVRFVVTQGGGRIVESQPVHTDSAGIASAQWILGPEPGLNRVEATAPGLEEPSVEFTAFGIEPTAAAIAIESGDEQPGTAGMTLPFPLVVKVTDASGSPVFGVAVTFEVILGDGAFVTPSVDTTDGYGLAETYLTLSPGIGTNMVKATAQGVTTTVTFMAEASSGVAARLEINDGNNQVYYVGRTLPQPLVAKATDVHGNGVANVAVTFTVVQGNGSVPAENTKITDAFGFASISLTLGITAGTNKVEARSSGLTPVTFTATGTADAPASIVKYSGDNQTGSAGRELVYPIRIKLLDQYGNPVPNKSVRFVVTQGGGSFVEDQPVYTNSNGIASTRWVMGLIVGENKCWAIKQGCTNSPLEFTATAVENNFPVLSFNPAGPFTIQETQRVQFSVSATDDDGDPITYGARRLPQGARFDSLGTRAFEWTPTYTQSGVYHPIFIARDNKGGIDVDSVRIEVQNFNRSPSFTNFSPIDQNVTIVYPADTTFSVEATDADGDSLMYQWTQGGMIVSETNTYVMESTQWALGSYTVKVEVSDGEQTLPHTWYLDVVTAVELQSFSASTVPYKGVKLDWKTSAEFGNLGFDILRSNSSEGVYKTVNAEVLPSRSDMTYTFLDNTAVSGNVYYYKLVDIDVSGLRTEHGPITVDIPVPKKFSLSQNYPNPFNPQTTIRYELPKTSEVTINIYNIAGQVVRTLAEGETEAGYHTVVWDGRDESGLRVTSGVYYYRMIADNFCETKKMAILK